MHDFASAVYEQSKEYDCFWDWFKEAVEEMIKEDESNGLINRIKQRNILCTSSCSMGI